MLNRRMPNGTYGGVRGERKSPLLDFEEDRKMAISKGMNDHIAKPIDVKKVEEVIISVLK